MRLPLLLPTDLTAEQRPLYVSFEKMVQARVAIGDVSLTGARMADRDAGKRSAGGNF
jgi:hypothetical protein